jgi:WS/DGAT/MGAT family acyltransferase
MFEPPYFDPRMSDAEGLMWRLEKDPYLSSTFANLTILDRKPDMELVRRRLARTALVVPRLRQRVWPAPANLAAPIWVDDPNFDLDYHVRHVALPKPSSLRQLLDYATLVACDPFDRTRPLWQFVIVEGLPRGRAALIEKLHHTLADGESSVRLSLQFLDLERDAPELPPVDPETIAASVEASEPSSAEAMRDLVAGSLRLPLGLVRQLRDLVADPSQLPTAGAAAVETLRGLITQLSEVDGARSPLWGQRSLRRHLEVVRAPFDATKQAAKRLGGSLNTAFLTAASHGAGAYHRELGVPVEELRASMAISTRTESSGSNAFSLARFLVPTGDLSIEERFARIQNASAEAKATGVGASLEALASLASTLPTSLLTRVARQQAQTIDFATSNVRGAPIPMFFGGAQILENYPVGPLAGVAFNLTLLSYLGSLDMGLHIDAAAVARPERLRAHIEQAFRDLAAC